MPSKPILLIFLFEESIPLLRIKLHELQLFLTICIISYWDYSVSILAPLIPDFLQTFSASASFEVDTATVSVKDGRRTYKVHTSSTSRSDAGPLCAQDGGTLLRLTSPYDQIWRVSKTSVNFLKERV